MTRQAASRKSLTRHDASMRAVAYYRSGPTDEASTIDRQREQVRKWAEKHGLEIVREFEDRDTSALEKQPRPGFGELKEWVKQDRDLRYILCRDPSRWCRFVDSDLAVSYYRKCLKAGRRVVYTILDMPPEADSLYSTFLHFHRWLAAPSCCQHGARVQRGRMFGARKIS